MEGLELKVPPVALMLITGGCMWFAGWLCPELTFPLYARIELSLFLFACGAGVASAGVLAFRRAQTTVDPRRPEVSTSIVTTGIYQLSRNPMYLGFLLTVLAWAIFLSNVLAAALPAFFVMYMNRFQISPEERILRARFGTAYEVYLRSTRRWV